MVWLTKSKFLSLIASTALVIGVLLAPGIAVAKKNKECGQKTLTIRVTNSGSRPILGIEFFWKVKGTVYQHNRDNHGPLGNLYAGESRYFRIPAHLRSKSCSIIRQLKMHFQCGMAQPGKDTYRYSTLKRRESQFSSKGGFDFGTLELKGDHCNRYLDASTVRANAFFKGMFTGVFSGRGGGGWPLPTVDSRYYLVNLSSVKNSYLQTSGTGVDARAMNDEAAEAGFGMFDINGGNLLAGDTVSLRASNRKYLTLNADGSLSATGSSRDAKDQFTIRVLGKAPGELVAVGDSITLQGSNGKYLIALQSGFAGVLVSSTNTSSAATHWTIAGSEQVMQEEVGGQYVDAGRTAGYTTGKPLSW